LELLWDDCQEYKLGRTLDEAWDEWARKLAETYPADTVTIGDLFDRMLVSEIPNMPRARAEIYITSFRRLRPVFGHVRMESVTHDHASKYLDLSARRQWRGVGNGITSAANDIDVLTNCLSQAAIWGLVDENPLLEPPRKDRPILRRYLEPWEISEIMFMGIDENIDRRRRRTLQIGKCYVALKLITGATRRELLTLGPGHIKSGGILIGDDIVPWDPDGFMRSAVNILRSMAPTHRDPYLIVSRLGKPYHDPDTDSHRGFDSLWRRFVSDVVKMTAIKEPFAELHLVAARNDLAAIATALSNETGENPPFAPGNASD
jgi:hypothetical protein